jgi:hypothetical protein
MKIKQLFWILAVFAFVALAQNVLFGQAVNFAQIQGRVMDASGAAVAGAKITVTQTTTGLVRNTTSNASGQYSLPSLPVGAWELRASAPGFGEFVQKGIVLQVGEEPQINITMKVGNVSETIEVKSDVALVETHDNSVSTVIDNTRILEMPLNGRNLPDLVMIAGAASNNTLPSNDLNSSKNYGNNVTGASQTISVAGNQQNANNYLLDGGDNRAVFSNINAPFPFPDAVQEFSVQTNGLGARYGVHSGATINAVTKSGTNRFHGTAFEFYRTPGWNAIPVQFSANANASPGTLHRNQFGGTFGGPIKKDKMFFFMGYQGTRQSSSANPISVFVPTAAAFNGDFSTMFGGQNSCPTKTLKSYGGVTITGNKLDPSKFNPQALALLQYVPASTDPNGCGKISYTYPQTFNEDQGVTKWDWTISQKHNLFARYYITDSRFPLPFDASNVLPQSQASNQFGRFQSGVIGDTYSISNNIVNSLHLTLTRMAINRGPAVGMINPSDLGINVPSPVETGLIVSISNYFSTGGGTSMPGHFINNLWQIADDVDIVKGKHQLAFGVNWMPRMQLNYLSTFQSNGQWSFGAGSSGNAGKTSTGDNLVDFMLGFPSNFVQGNPEWENWRYTYFGLYASDSIRVRPNLTVNLGIRWEPYLPSVDTANRGSHFDYNNFANNIHSTVFPNAPAGLLYYGDAGVPRGFADKNWLQFAPRLGFAWDMFGDGKQSLRGSYGIFYDTPEMYYFDRYADNSPYGSGVSFAPSTAGGFTNPYLGQGGIPQFPLPFPQPGDPNAYFPKNGVYINNSFDVKPMYVQNWNLSFERQLAQSWVLSLSYMGNKTTHIWAAYEANPGLNQAVPANAVSGCTPNQAASTSNTNCRRSLYVANPSVGQYFSNMTSLWDGANGNYNAFFATIKHPFGNNFTVLGNYTWSHCISDQDFTGELTNSRPTLFSSPVNAPNFDALANDHGNCGFDVRNSFNITSVLTSPKVHGKAGYLLSDWSLAPLISYRTGIPFTVLTGVDTGLQGTTTSFKDRPNQAGDPYSGTCKDGTPVGQRNCYFNNSTAAYTIPAAGTFGNVPRNSLYGPTNFRFDVSVTRKFNVAESKSLLLRFDSFNLLNHPNYGNPVAGLNSSSSGRIQSQSGDSRTLQLAMKFAF